MATVRELAVIAHGQKSEKSIAQIDEARDFFAKDDQGMVNEILDIVGDLSDYQGQNIPFGEVAAYGDVMRLMLHYAVLRSRINVADEPALLAKLLGRMGRALDILLPKVAEFCAEAVHNLEDMGVDPEEDKGGHVSRLLSSIKIKGSK